MYLCEDTDIPENFLNAGNYEDIRVVGGSAKGRKNLNVISSSRINGLTLSWNDEILKFANDCKDKIKQYEEEKLLHNKLNEIFYFN